MAIVDELLVGLGFEFDEKELGNFQKSVDSTTKVLGNFIKVTFAATAAVGALLGTSAKATDEVTKQARQVNVLTGEYDALLHASEITTGSSQSVSAALQNLSVRASEAARGVGSGVEAFGMLGISATDANGKIKTTDVLLSETADALNNLEDESQRLELADKLGLKEINLLLLEGSGGIKKLTDEAKALGVITEEDAKAAEAFNDAQSRMLRVLNTVRRMIATGLLPELQNVIDTFTEWLKANKAIIKQRFQVFVKVLGKVLSVLGKTFGIVLDILGRFVDTIGGLDNALRLLVITFGAIIAMRIGALFLSFVTLMRSAGTAALVMNAKMLLIPILIGLAIAALALLIEDIITFINGGDSLFGEMLKEFPLINKAFEILREILSEVWDFVQMIGKGIGEFAGAAITNITKVIEDPAGVAGDILESVTPDENTLSNIGGFLKSISPFADSEKEGNGFNPLSSEPPESAGSTNNASSNSTVTQTNTFQITSDNPVEVGETVKKVIEDMIDTGINNTVSAVEL